VTVTKHHSIVTKRPKFMRSNRRNKGPEDGQPSHDSTRLRVVAPQDTADTGSSADGGSPAARRGFAASLAASVTCATAWCNCVATRSAPVFSSALRSSASSVFSV